MKLRGVSPLPNSTFSPGLILSGMSTDSEVATPVATADRAVPRRAVIDSAWRSIGSGVEVLSGQDGAPLRRTVKRILDPLVLRLRVNAAFSAPVVDGAAADSMRHLIVSHAAQLQATAAWFDVLKRERRRQKITTGNAQELYFPVCFELAVTRGRPEPGDRDAAEQVLRDIHDDRDRTAVEVLNDFVADEQVLAALSRQLETSWRDVRPGGGLTGPFLAGLVTVLGSAESHREIAARQRVWAALIADATPYTLGARARTDRPELPWSIVELGLCRTLPQTQPALISDRPGSTGVRPLDRCVVDRVRATLRRALDRDELPDIPLLLAEEIDRSCAPWGLLAEDTQAALIAGIEVAVELAPLMPDAAPRYHLAGQIQARLRKEAYVLHARRCLADGAAVHPRQRQVVDELAAFARPYLNRLWARLHGRDVWQDSCADVDDLCALLDGVARSVSLDHRQRIKAMLEVRAGTC